MFSSRELNPWSWSTLILALDSKFPISLRTTPWDECHGKITTYPTDSKLTKHLLFLAFRHYKIALPLITSKENMLGKYRWDPWNTLILTKSLIGCKFIEPLSTRLYSVRTNQYLPYMRLLWSLIHQQKHGRKGDNSERYAKGNFWVIMWVFQSKLGFDSGEICVVQDISIFFSF